jgi:hypothetical protein
MRIGSGRYALLCVVKPNSGSMVPSPGEKFAVADLPIAG